MGFDIDLYQFIWWIEKGFGIIVRPGRYHLGQGAYVKWDNEEEEGLFNLINDDYIIYDLITKHFAVNDYLSIDTEKVYQIKEQLQSMSIADYQERYIKIMEKRGKKNNVSVK